MSGAGEGAIPPVAGRATPVVGETAQIAGRPATVAAALLCAALVALGGCGGVKAPDLFVVERTGDVAGARLTLLVDEEGGVHCNGAQAPKLSDPALIEARALQEELHDLASKHTALAPGPRSVLHYRLREESGTIAFSDDSAGQPRILRRLVLFVLQTAQRNCHLPL